MEHLLLVHRPIKFQGVPLTQLSSKCFYCIDELTAKMKPKAKRFSKHDEKKAVSWEIIFSFI